MSDPLKLSALEELEQWGQNVGLSSSIPEPQPPTEPILGPTPEPEAPVDPLAAWSQGVQEQVPEPITTERPERQGALERLGDWIQKQRVGGAQPEGQLAPGFPVEQTQAFGAPPPEPPPPEPEAVPIDLDMVAGKAKGWLVDFLEAGMPEDPEMARPPAEPGLVPQGDQGEPIFSAQGAVVGYKEPKEQPHPLMYASGLMQGLAEQVPETAANMSELMAYALDQPGSAMLPIQQQEGLSWALKKTAKVLRGGAEKHRIQREIEGTFMGIPYSDEFQEMMRQQAEGGTDLLAQIKEDPLNTLLTASAQSLPVMAGMIATTAASGGSVPAAMASGILFESANSWGEARAQGKSEHESAVSAAVGGILAGSVEGWAGGQLLKRFGLPSLKGFGKWVGDRAVDALREGGTEGFQYYLSQFGALVAEWSQNPGDLTLDQMKQQFEERILSKETFRQAAGEAAVGATVGPMFGAGGTVVAKSRQSKIQQALETLSELASEEQQRIAAAEENRQEAELLRATVEEIEGGPPPPGAAAAPLVIEEEGVEEQAIEPPERPIEIPTDSELSKELPLAEPKAVSDRVVYDTAERAGRTGREDFELPLGTSPEQDAMARRVHQQALEAFHAKTAEEKQGAIPREPGAEPAKAAPSQPPPAAEAPQYEKSERGPVDPDKLFPAWIDRDRTLPSGAATLTREEVGKLVLAPDDFQFKGDHDDKGQTQESHIRQVKTAEDWNPELARGATVWYNPETGETHPVNGHNRVAKYQDLGVTDDLEVYFINADSMKEARAVGALQNLSEGHGTVMDAATFFRDSGMSMEDIEALNLPLHGRLNSLGAGLSQTSDLLFQAVRDGTLSEAHGAVIGEMLPVHSENRANTDDENYAGQAAILKELKKRKKLTIDEVRSLAGSVARAGTRVEVADQLTIDGFSNMITKSNFVEMAQVESFINRKLAKDKKLHGMVSQAENAEELEAHGSRIAAQESLKLSKDAATLTGLWEKFKHGYEVTPIIEEAARLLATPKATRPVGFKTDNQVLKDAYRKARQALAATLGGELAKREVEPEQAPRAEVPVAEEAAPEPRVAPEVPKATEPVGEPAAVEPPVEAEVTPTTEGTPVKEGEAFQAGDMVRDPDLDLTGTITGGADIEVQSGPKTTKGLHYTVVWDQGGRDLVYGPDLHKNYEVTRPSKEVKVARATARMQREFAEEELGTAPAEPVAAEPVEEVPEAPKAEVVAPEPTEEAPRPFQVGDIVRHPSGREGVVEKVNPEGEPTVHFDDSTTGPQGFTFRSMDELDVIEESTLPGGLNLQGQQEALERIREQREVVAPAATEELPLVGEPLPAHEWAVGDKVRSPDGEHTGEIVKITNGVHFVKIDQTGATPKFGKPIMDNWQWIRPTEGPSTMEVGDFTLKKTGPKATLIQGAQTELSQLKDLLRMGGMSSVLSEPGEKWSGLNVMLPIDEAAAKVIKYTRKAAAKTKAAPPSPEEFTLTAEQQKEQEAPRRERLEAEINRLAEQEAKLKSSKYADDQATVAHSKILQERREALELELEQEGPSQAQLEAAGQQNMFAAMEAEPEVEVAEETRQPAKSTEMALQLAELATVRMHSPAELRPLLLTIEETARGTDDPVVTFFTKHPEHKKAFDFIFGRVSGAKNHETRERSPGVGDKPGYEFVLSSIGKWPTAAELKAGAHYTLQMAGPFGVIRIEGKATGEIKVNAILPSAGKPPLRGKREQGGFLRMGQEAPEAAGPAVTFNAEQEAEYRKAREGVPQKRWWESVIEGAKALPQAFLRQFPKLARGNFFAQASEALRHIGIFPESAANEVSRKLNQIIGSLDPAEYDLFTRAMLVDNIMWLWKNRPEMYTPDMFEDITLPFGWNPETLEADYNATHAALEQSPKVQEAIDQMRQYWNEVRAKVRESFHKIGQSTHFLDRQGDMYMHHQILQYALEEGMWGPGGGVKAPLGRPHQRKMVGSAKAFNLQYLVTQGNVLTQLLIDANIADQIDRIIQHYDIKADLVDKAKGHNVALMKELLATDEDPTGEQGYDEWNAGYRQKIAGATNTIVRLALGYTNKEGEVFGLPDGIWSRWEELLTDLQESYRDWEAINAELDKEEKEPFYFDHPDWFPMLADMLNNYGGEMGSGAAATVFKTIREREDAKKEMLKGSFTTWMDHVPKDHGLWQPAKGQIFFRVMTISDRVAQEVLEKGLAEVAGEDIKEMLAMGGPKTITVLPGPLAETLNDAAEAMRGYQQYKFIKYNEVAVRAWKQWQLLSPRRAPRYFTRNLVGDFHKVLMGNPAALRRLPQAVGELRDVIYGGQTPGEDMRAWLNLGGISAGMFQQEIEQSEMEKLVDLLQAEAVQSWVRKPTENLPQGAKKPPALVRYFRFMRKHAQFLESMLRYAAYTEYLDQIKTNGKPSNYGASRREEIEAFRGEPNVQAYWLSNQLVGAYDQISYAGQFLRKEIVPFWSFQELNVRQHLQLLKNALNDDDFGYHISKRLLGSVALRAPYLAAKAGKWYLLAKALEIMFFSWNHIMFPDEEDKLPADVRNTPHLTFGTDSQGNIIYFNRLSVFHEFREWFGMGDSGHLTNEWLNGRMTAYQVAKEMSTSVVDKIYNSIGPWSLYGIKGATELLFRVSGFPSATRPKAIRDRTEYLMHQFGLDNEFRMLTGRPQRTPGDTPIQKYLASIPELFVYRAEPGATAFFDNLSEKNRFFRNVLGRDEYTISWNPRTTTLLNMKRAISFGQEEVALKYLEQYAQMPGASKKGLNSSFRQMHPMWGLSNKARRQAYLDWIGPEGQHKLTMATAYYENLISEAQAMISPETLISLGLD